MAIARPKGAVDLDIIRQNYNKNRE